LKICISETATKPYTYRYGQLDDETENDKSHRLNRIKNEGQKNVS